MVPFPSWSFLLVLVPSVGFSSIIVSGGFLVSRGMRLWETDLPNLLIFGDAFVWTLPIVKDQPRTIDLLEDHHDIESVGFDLLPQFMQIMLSARLCTLTTSMTECHLHMHSGEYRRWYNTAYLSGCFGTALCELLNYLEAIKNWHMYIFLMTSLVMEWCVCDGWASCSIV